MSVLITGGAVIGCEILVAAGDVLAAEVGYTVMLLVLVNARSRSADVTAALQALGIVALARVVAIAAPLPDAAGAVHLLVVALATAFALWRLAPPVEPPIREVVVRLGPYGEGGVLWLSLGLGLLLYGLGLPALVGPEANAGEVALALLAVAVAATVEEVLFRGVLQSLLERLLGRPGVLVASALFASLYLSAGSPALVLAVALAGVVFAASVFSTRVLGSAVAGHIVLAGGAVVVWPALFGAPHDRLPGAAATPLLAVAVGVGAWLLLTRPPARPSDRRRAARDAESPATGDIPAPNGQSLGKRRQDSGTSVAGAPAPGVPFACMDAVPAAGRRASGGPTFELERFTWGTPDRLELEGRFAGLDQLPADPPVLVVHGGTRTQRLPAVAGGDSDADGHWQAAFAWQDAPAAFDSARLELGDTIAVDLPGPGLRRRPFRRQVLEVQWLEAAPAAGEAAEAGAASGPAGDVDAGPGTERLHLHADLLAAREEARELEAALQRATDELERVREDLDAARADHAADSERFREGLASVRLTAEEALVAERATAESTRAELARTTDELEDLRERLAAAEEARAVAEADASGLREQIDSATTSRDDLIAAHDDAERLLRRLTDIRDALEPGG